MTKELLHKYYIDNKESVFKIATTFNVSVGTIYYWLHKYGIKVNHRGIPKLNEENKEKWRGIISKTQKTKDKNGSWTFPPIRKGKKNNKFSGGKTYKVSCLLCGKEILLNKKDSETRKFCSRHCYYEYYRVKKTCKNCNKEFKVHRSKQMRVFCSIRCSREHFRGTNHYNWHGGISNYSYEFNVITKTYIRNFYNNECFICRKKQDNIKPFFPIHHIDYNKLNNSYYNLVPLCPQCHTKTNYNREYWTGILMALVIKRTLGLFYSIKLLVA